MADFTDDEKNTLRSAALTAITLVSKADPGFLAMFKESAAGSKALTSAPPDIRELFTAGGLPKPPQGADLESAAVTGMQSATRLLQAKAPEKLDGFKDVILAACQEVAGASKGVSAEETAAIEKVRAALR